MLIPSTYYAHRTGGKPFKWRIACFLWKHLLGILVCKWKTGCFYKELWRLGWHVETLEPSKKWIILFCPYVPNSSLFIPKMIQFTKYELNFHSTILSWEITILSLNAFVFEMNAANHKRELLLMLQWVTIYFEYFIL